MKSRVAHFANLDVRSSIDLKIKVTKIKLQIFFKTVLLGIGQNRICKPFGVGRRHRAKTQNGGEMAVYAHLRRGICGDVKIGTTGIRHLPKKLRKRDRRFDSRLLIDAHIFDSRDS